MSFLPIFPMENQRQFYQLSTDGGPPKNIFEKLLDPPRMFSRANSSIFNIISRIGPIFPHFPPFPPIFPHLHEMYCRILSRILGGLPPNIFMVADQNLWFCENKGSYNRLYRVICITLITLKPVIRGLITRLLRAKRARQTRHGQK